MDREPEPLRGDARRMLTVWRDADDMPADARARVQRRLLAPTRASPVRARGHAMTIAFALAAALLLAWWIAGMSARSEHASHEGGREQASDRATAPAPARTEPIAPAELPAATPATTTADETTPDAATTEPRRGPRPRTAGHEATSIDTLAREKALVQQAWETLAAGDPDGALRIVDTHAREFPEGVLAPERRAVTLVARCKRGDADATERAAAWLHSAARSPLAARVRAACNLETP